MAALRRRRTRSSRPRCAPPARDSARSPTCRPPGRDAVAPRGEVDSGGDAIVVWQRPDGTNTIVQAAGHDAAGPQLRGLNIPATAVAGTAARLRGVAARRVVAGRLDAVDLRRRDERVGRKRLARLRLRRCPHRGRDRDGRPRQRDRRDARGVGRRLAGPGQPPPPPPVSPPAPPPPPACTTCASKPPKLNVAIGFDAHVTKRYTVFTKLVVQPAVRRHGGPRALHRSRLPIQAQDAQRHQERAPAGSDHAGPRREAAPRRADRGPGDEGRHGRGGGDDRGARSQAPAARRALPVPGRSRPGALPRLDPHAATSLVGQQPDRVELQHVVHLGGRARTPPR